MRFPVEVVRRSRELVGADFPIVYRISLLDLVEGGQTWDEVVELAHLLEDAGVTALNTGIGWHEARVPTIITQVPPRRLALAHRAAQGRGVACRSARPTGSTPPSWPSRSSPRARPTWCRWPGRCSPTPTSSTRRPPAAPTRSTPASPATRPASTTRSRTRRRPAWSTRAPAARPTLVLRCRTRRARRRSRSWAPGRPAWRPRCPPPSAASPSPCSRSPARSAASSGSRCRCPARRTSARRCATTRRRLEVLGVDVRLGAEATAADLARTTTSSSPPASSRGSPTIAGIDHPKVVSYAEVLSGRVVPGRRVAVIGAGGIGVDVSHFLTHDPADGPDDWMAHWGVGDPAVHPGGLTEPKPRTPLREVTLVQRKTTPIGIGLGKTSGWAHRAVLKQSGVGRSAARRTSASTTPACTSPSTASRGARRRPRRAVRRARSRCAACTTARRTRRAGRT